MTGSCALGLVRAYASGQTSQVKSDPKNCIKVPRRRANAPGLGPTSKESNMARVVGTSAWSLNSAFRGKVASGSREWLPSGSADHWDVIPKRSVALRSVGQVIYAIRFGDVIKIGSTANLQMRLNRLRYANGPDELLCILPGTLTEELALHQRFKAHRAHGREWYHPAPEILDWINTNRQQLGLDPVAS